MAARTSRTKKTPVSCSLDPALAERLVAEADERDVSPSYLITKGLGLLFDRYDHPAPASSATSMATGKGGAL